MKTKILQHHAGRAVGDGHEFRHGNSEARTRPMIRDSRHQAHPRGGNHRSQTGRVGNPKG